MIKYIKAAIKREQTQTCLSFAEREQARTKSKAYIQGLLDKFMAGTSTLEEEDTLAHYFRTQDIPQEWEAYRLLFQEIEAMKPKSKPKRRWTAWVAAAAVIAGLLYLAIPSSQTQPSGSLVAEADTTAIQSTEETETELVPDTMVKHEENVLPVQTKKRRLRKPEPTIHDYDKAYTMMAEAELERIEAERQVEQMQHEMIDAQLAAYGFIPVMQEDGTIIYINEQTNDIAYEE